MLAALTSLASAAAPRAQTAPKPTIVFTTDYADAELYLDGSLICRGSCGLQDGTPGATYVVTCRKPGYRDGTASAVFPVSGSVSAHCAMSAQTEAVAPLPVADEEAALPEPGEVLTAPVIDAIVGSNASLRQCFADAEARGETHTGRFWVQFWVTPDGSVGNARITADGYDGTLIASCVTSQLDRLRFPPFAGMQGKKIDYPLMVGTWHVGTAGGDSGTVVEPEDDVMTVESAGITPALVDAVVNGNREIRSCLTAARRQGVARGSEIWVKFTIEPAGTVRAARLTSSRYTGTEIEDCLCQRLNQLWFPASSGDTAMSVKVRLVVE